MESSPGSVDNTIGQRRPFLNIFFKAAPRYRSQFRTEDGGGVLRKGGQGALHTAEEGALELEGGKMKMGGGGA